ncbi:uncharacterized protein PV07_08582 [Cladophialophora immunda]|uniref:Aminoglycoside phosphotransferase domain-containing protein n=1 Tax=Cladophialophora immunda TaxID=569365 RepID=A0A0D2C4J8_9EURO|nr:uncharacterized protein PV07_08582 [Cladophialophora immunda]KIW25405.1 hypothetical protein PV07_08582 [Cladophialophora immunda]
MKDGLQIVARLPYPSNLPKRSAVATEVATMDLIRSYSLTVPRVYGYSATSKTPVASEYIIMEKIGGKEIGHIRYDLSMEEKRQHHLAGGQEAALFSIHYRHLEPCFANVICPPRIKVLTSQRTKDCALDPM